MKKIRIHLRFDNNDKIGGVRQIYRHVDVLNQLGYDAAVVHVNRGFRCDWFENNTRTIGFADLELGENDYLVLPELYPDVPQFNGVDKCKIVVYAQNPFIFLDGFGGTSNLFNFYNDRVSAVMCVSEHSRKHLQSLLPKIPVHRIVYSFDNKPFSLSKKKNNIISFMPRKRGKEIDLVLRILKEQGLLRGWSVETISQLSENEVAKILSKTAIFLAGGEREGFGMPIAEAMVCGCVVVGWHGYGGEELFKPEFSYAIPDGDVFAFTETMKSVLSKDLKDLLDMGRKASDFILQNYNTTLEVESIKSAWEKITKQEVLEFPSDVMKEKDIEPEQDVETCQDNKREFAGFILAEDTEGLAKSIKWLSPRVKKLFVIEGKGGLLGDKEHTDKIKNIVLGLNLSNIEYHLLEHKQLPISEINEPYLRTKGFEVIKKQGFEWVWVVDPGETYLDIELESLNSYLEKVLTEDKNISGIKYKSENVIVRSDSIFVWGRNITEQCIVREFYMDKSFISQRSKKRIKAIILNHNKPENADKLYELLNEAFDVEIWDSGSDSDKMPINLTKSYPNIYWTGAWNEIMRLYSDYDVVWMLGCDIELRSKSFEYLEAIEKSLPFGCWSPCVEGRAHPFMQAHNYVHGEPVRVKNIEGMCMALSGNLMRKVNRLMEGSQIGFGQDFWLCYVSRQYGMENIIDGRVKVYHPAGIGYDENLALQQMEETFGGFYGKNYRWNIFEYDETYEGNKMNQSKIKKEVLIPEVLGRQLTLITVDNGWGYSDFLRLTSGLDVRKIVLVKGVAELIPEQGVELVRYDNNFEKVLSMADLALFPKLGATNRGDFIKVLQAGIPTVVHVMYHTGIINHMKNGFIYQSDDWALRWLNDLIHKEDLRRSVREELKNNKVEMPVIQQVAGCGSCQEKARQMAELRKKSIQEAKERESNSEIKEQNSVVGVKSVIEKNQPNMIPPIITVITPTYRRDPHIIQRCIDCVKIQNLANWEQLICSDGEEEEHVKKLVERNNDPRVKYFYTTGKKEGDYGNTVRSEMLKKVRGPYVLFFDDDNIIMPEYFEKMLKAIVIENVDFVVCQIMHHGPLHESLGKPPIVLKGEPVKLHYIDPLQVLVKTEVMRKVGWDTEVGYLSDGVTLEKLGKDYKHVRVEEVLGVHV